jgi:hypothetical protein
VRFVIQGHRLYFDGKGPVLLRELLLLVSSLTGPLIIWSARSKSFHLIAPGYGNVAGVAGEAQTISQDLQLHLVQQFKGL